MNTVKNIGRGFTVSGSSIAETVLAIAIITICSLVATLVFTSVYGFSPIYNDFESNYQLEKMSAQVKEEKNIEPETFVFDDFRITKIVQEVSAGIYEVTLLVEGIKDSKEKKVYIKK